VSSDPIDIVFGQVLAELAACTDQISGEGLDQAVALVEAAPRVFVVGAGRSGLCMQAFGMRLMQLGITGFVVGETMTPSITAGDLLIIGSGSGKTKTLQVMTEKAQQQEARILLFTADAASPLAEMADHLVVIPGPLSEDAEGEQGLTSVQPLGTLFEQCLLILCDTLILALMQQMGVDEAQMAQRHANLQ